jgi:hypothetical protein
LQRLCSTARSTVDAIDEDGRTPLILAAQNSAERTCVLLAERGANLHVKARDGKSAIDVLRLINRGLATKLEAIERKAGIEQLVATARAQWLAQHGGLSFDGRATLRNAETVERIRRGTFDPLTDPLVKTAAQGAARSHAVGARSCGASAAVSFDDLNELLCEQEALGTRAVAAVSACARSHARGARRHRQPTSIALLREYVRVAGSDELADDCREGAAAARVGALEIGIRESDAEAAVARRRWNTRWAELSAQLTPTTSASRWRSCSS